MHGIEDIRGSRKLPKGFDESEIERIREPDADIPDTPIYRVMTYSGQIVTLSPEFLARMANLHREDFRADRGCFGGRPTEVDEEDGIERTPIGHED